MGTIELKNRIHSLVDTIVDDEKLQSVMQYLQSINGSDDWWDDLTENQKQSINEGISQLDNGERIPHDQVKKSVDKLLGRA